MQGSGGQFFICIRSPPSALPHLLACGFQKVSSLKILPNPPRLSQESTLGVSAALSRLPSHLHRRFILRTCRSQWSRHQLHIPTVPIPPDAISHHHRHPAPYRPMKAPRRSPRKTHSTPNTLTSTNPASVSPKKCHPSSLFLANPRSVIICIRDITTNHTHRLLWARMYGGCRWICPCQRLRSRLRILHRLRMQCMGRMRCGCTWPRSHTGASRQSPRVARNRGRSRVIKLQITKVRVFLLLAFRFRLYTFSQPNLFVLPPAKACKFYKISKTCPKGEECTLYVPISFPAA